ncbi:hypothetical protein CEUSTIGMA_g11723.t1 [Chlamydomonas eustigma]|uniref:DUF1682 domain-containing protein n=1 Tax=Chlamydomonas eustigma TaxID=1157962 RepID=A0A250XMG9_9CHLO|nr:hypothetical protein CEUSTIGMA_g11723.t1 [Chlamydomonas eustigma]|eukprot:GAX84301.1 hypothetical protein CEUSTIGMA_g11723.t1 [Chlamydomonas eustigma]
MKRLNVVKDLLLITVLIFACAHSQSDLEGFEDIETVSDDVSTFSHSSQHLDQTAEKENKQDSGDAPILKNETTGLSSAAFNRGQTDATFKYMVEISSAAFCLIYIITAFYGSSFNKRIAEAWTKSYAFKGGLFEKNFSSLGSVENVPLMRESGNLFKFYATGRRYCHGLLAELKLLPRQDFISMVWNLLSPTEDLVQIEVYMTDEAMPPIVLAIATPKYARVLQRDSRDVQRYTKKISISKDIFPSWHNDKLWVLGEHSSVVQDLFSDTKIQLLLSFSGPYAAGMKYFRSLHFTSENPEGSHKRVLRFQFKLPPPAEMDAISKLLDCVPLFIDVVGTYKLPADLKRRVLESRAKQEEDEEELKKKRFEAIQQKRLEKAQEERAKLLRMSPDARLKYEEKMQRQNAKKAMKTKAVRI